MKLFVRALGPVFLGLVFSSTAFADSITLNRNLSSPTYLSYTFTDAVSGASIQEWVSPYPSTSTIEGVDIPSQFGCMDINNPTVAGATYSGTFGVAVTTADYEVSWLADQAAGTTPSNPLIIGGVDESGPIAMAIWEIEFPSSTKTDGTTMPIDPAAQTWIDQATAAVKAGYQPDSVFFTPDVRTSQRFVEISLTSKPGTLDLLPAPEPGTLGMLGAGLMGLVGLLRRKLPR